MHSLDFRHPTLGERLLYPLRALWYWLYSNLHMAKATYDVLDFMFVHKIGAGQLAPDHPWLTGLIPGTPETVWQHNIVFASPRGAKWRIDPESDRVIVTRIGKFLAAMVERSNFAHPEIPQGKCRRMPHAVNYLHGAVHYNGGFLIFDDFADAMFHFSDPHFVAEFKAFARAEKRELTIVLRERSYHPEEYAWFIGFIRAHQPWYANGNGPTKRRVLYGTPSPYPAINPINGSWVVHMRNLYRRRLGEIVQPPLGPSRYFKGSYQGNQRDYAFIERFHVWAQNLVVIAKGFQGALVFSSRAKIEPENLRKYKDTRGEWRSSYRVPHPFRPRDLAVIAQSPRPDIAQSPRQAQ